MRVITAAVAAVVRRQREVGIDIVSDGEMSKISYATYVAHRFSGFDGDTPREPGQDLVEFPGLLQQARRARLDREVPPAALRRAEVTLKDGAPVQADIANLKAASAAAPTVAAFMNAASPGVIALFQPNDYYPTQDAYLEALAEALRSEYEAIVQRRDHPADRCAGSGDGPPHDVPRPLAGGVRRAAPRATSRC